MTFLLIFDTELHGLHWLHWLAYLPTKITAMLALLLPTPLFLIFLATSLIHQKSKDKTFVGRV
jgi:hypothetical protein